MLSSGRLIVLPHNMSVKPIVNCALLSKLELQTWIAKGLSKDSYSNQMVS
jgi:hypothetical protein